MYMSDKEEISIIPTILSAIKGDYLAWECARPLIWMI